MTAIPQPPTHPGCTINPIGCCLCFCLAGARTDAATVIDGYAVCGEHAEWMARPYTDFAEMIRRHRTDPSQAAT